MKPAASAAGFFVAQFGPECGRDARDGVFVSRPILPRLDFTTKTQRHREVGSRWEAIGDERFNLKTAFK
jgi:hypothetical protein